MRRRKVAPGWEGLRVLALGHSTHSAAELITSRTRALPHSPTPFARIRGLRVTYPPALAEAVEAERAAAKRPARSRPARARRPMVKRER